MCSLAALGAIACAPQVTTRQSSVVLPPDLRPVKTAEFDAWVASFRRRALRSGISQSILDVAFSDAGFVPGVITRDRSQIQTRRTLGEYLSIATSQERLAKGRRALDRHMSLLEQIEMRYGVSVFILAAIWGLETQYGEKRGNVPVISATATLAFEGRRGAFYERQLLAALLILQDGDTTIDQLRGSWAGAMGHTQFIPTSYRAFAVDFASDGRRDIWGEDPTDALASTGQYLARNGWQSGLPWGGEVGTDSISAGRIIQPQAGGVRFVVTRNFDVIKTYNNSNLYAIGVGHLADRLRGAGPLRGRFPPDANGLTKDDRLIIQRRLAAQGYDVGTIDGVIGDTTSRAIAAYQTAQGLPVTGIATPALLMRLR